MAHSICYFLFEFISVHGEKPKQLQDWIPFGPCQTFKIDKLNTLKYINNNDVLTHVVRKIE